MTDHIVVIRPGLTAEKGIIVPGEAGKLRLSVVLQGLVDIELEPSEIDAIRALSLADGEDMANWIEASLQPDSPA